MGAVDDVDLRALLDEAEDGGTGCAARTEDGDARAAQAEALLQRADYTGDVGVEAVELAVCAGAEGVAGADAGGEGVHIGQMRQDLLLERHGDSDAGQGQLTDDGEQVVEGLGLEGQQDGVDDLAAEGCVVHERRERVSDGVTGDAEDACGLIDLIDAVDLAQGAGVDLAGRGFRFLRKRREGEGASCAGPEDAAQDAFFPHGDADDVGGERAVLDEAQDGEVVRERASGGDDFDEVGLEGFNAVGCLLQAAGAGEVVVADEQRGAGVAQVGDLRGLGGLGGLDFEIDDLAASLGSLGEDLKLSDERAGEASAVGFAPAGGDGDDLAVRCEKFLDLGEGEQRLGQGVEAELEEGGVAEGGIGALDEFSR